MPCSNRKREHGVLDLACGLGWLTIPMALRGFQVTGYDLSDAMLTRAQESAEQAKAQIEWVRGDMRSLPANWTATYDFVTLTLSEFGCFQDESDNQRVLAEVARVLKSGGRFLLDVVVNRDELILNGDRNSSFDGGGFFIVDKGSLDILSGIFTRSFQWYRQGQTSRNQLADPGLYTAGGETDAGPGRLPGIVSVSELCRRRPDAGQRRHGVSGREVACSAKGYVSSAPVVHSALCSNCVHPRPLPSVTPAPGPAPPSSCRRGFRGHGRGRWR